MRKRPGAVETTTTVHRGKRWNAEKALAAASAATLILGSTVVAGASMTGASFLGFGGGSHGNAGFGNGRGQARHRREDAQHLRQVRRRHGRGRNRGYGIRRGNRPGIASAGTTPTTAGAPGPTSGPDPATDPTTPTSQPGSPRRQTDETPAPVAHTTTPTTQPGDESPATTVAPSPTTVPTTTTTWPRGVPKDWPKDKPIPPMPPNCREPQLEDNGVWNCDH